MKKTFLIITGILLAILGVICACMPFRTFLAMGWIMGAALLINGISLLVGAKKDVWQIILGILVIIGGAAVLFSVAARVLTDVILAVIAGIIVLVYGIVLIVKGAKTVKVSKGAGIWSIIFGVISVLGGLYSAGHPFITMAVLGFVIAFNLIVQGVNTIILGATVNK